MMHILDQFPAWKQNRCIQRYCFYYYLLFCVSICGSLTCGFCINTAHYTSNTVVEICSSVDECIKIKTFVCNTERCVSFTDVHTVLVSIRYHKSHYKGKKCGCERQTSILSEIHLSVKKDREVKLQLDVFSTEHDSSFARTLIPRSLLL